MGNQKNYESCPFGDNPVFPAGNTPNILILTVTGVVMTTNYEQFNPNGVYYCIQVSIDNWASGTTPGALITINSGGIYVSAYDINNVTQFYANGLGMFPRGLAGKPCGDNFKYGQCSISCQGPEGNPAGDQAIALACGLYEPKSCQFEHNATLDLSARIRIAQKRDGSLVHLKKQLI